MFRPGSKAVSQPGRPLAKAGPCGGLVEAGGSALVAARPQAAA